MSVSPKFILQQGPVLRALVETAVAAKTGGGKAAGAVKTPGPVLSATLPPRDPEMVTAYIRHVGGDPSGYKGVLPPHLFPQWGFPLLSKTLKGIPYDMSRVLNAGCRYESRRPLPAGEPLLLQANLVEIDDNGERAILKQRLVTGTASTPEALVSELRAIVPLKKSEGGPKKEKPHVPEDAREVALWRIPKGAGLEFAMLTGDFNPIHWIPQAAHMAGFKNTILHGFSSLARTVESLNRIVYSGNTKKIKSIDVRFVRPVVLPAKARLFIDGAGGVFVGDAPGGPVYLVGNYSEREEKGS